MTSFHCLLLVKSFFTVCLANAECRWIEIDATSGCC